MIVMNTTWKGLQKKGLYIGHLSSSLFSLYFIFVMSTGRSHVHTNLSSMFTNESSIGCLDIIEHILGLHVHVRVVSCDSDVMVDQKNHIIGGRGLPKGKLPWSTPWSTAK